MSATSAVVGIGWSCIIATLALRIAGTVWLCEAHHRGTYGVHGKLGSYLDKKIKRECQAKFEETHTRKEFMQIIGRNYIQEEEEDESRNTDRKTD